MPYRMTPSVRHRAIEVHYYYYYYLYNQKTIENKKPKSNNFNSDSHHVESSEIKIL